MFFLCSPSLRLRYIFFFFQAEDGIRDVAVTGVQTCALPICPVSNVPRIAPRNPSGIETTVGLTSGQIASAPRTPGPIIANTTDETRPTSMPPTTPPVLNRRQKSERISTGKLALAATQIARSPGQRR